MHGVLRADAPRADGNSEQPVIAVIHPLNPRPLMAVVVMAVVGGEIHEKANRKIQ